MARGWRGWVSRREPSSTLSEIRGSRRTMIEHEIGVSLNVHVRVLIYEEPVTGTCRLAYDLPSSLMGRLKNDRVTAAARLLDQKLLALAETATGASA